MSCLWPTRLVLFFTNFHEIFPFQLCIENDALNSKQREGGRVHVYILTQCYRE